jgi:predicted small integral membrane protein
MMGLVGSGSGWAVYQLTHVLLLGSMSLPSTSRQCIRTIRPAGCSMLTLTLLSSDFTHLSYVGCVTHQHFMSSAVVVQVMAACSSTITTTSSTTTTMPRLSLPCAPAQPLEA